MLTFISFIKRLKTEFVFLHVVSIVTVSITFSEWVLLGSVLEVRQGIDDHHSVGLCLGGIVKGSSERLGTGEHWVLEAVIADVGCDNEVTDGDLVTSDELAAVMVEVGLDESVEFLDEGEESGEGSVFGLLIWSKGDSSELSLEVRPGVNDGVDVASLSPVLRVVVTKSDTERAKDGTELGHASGLATLSDEGLRETATELTTISALLSVFPASEVKVGLLMGLSVILEHLSEGITTTETFEVFPFHLGLDKTFLASLLLGSSGLGSWFGSWSARVATHGFSIKFYLIVINLTQISLLYTWIKIALLYTPK